MIDSKRKWIVKKLCTEKIIEISLYHYNQMEERGRVVKLMIKWTQAFGENH